MVFGFVAVVFCHLFGGWITWKKVENKFCQIGKGFYLCSPKRKPGYTGSEARGYRHGWGVGKHGWIGVRSPVWHDGRSVSGGVEALDRYRESCSVRSSLFLRRMIK